MIEQLLLRIFLREELIANLINYGNVIQFVVFVVILRTEEHVGASDYNGGVYRRT